MVTAHASLSTSGRDIGRVFFFGVFLPRQAIARPKNNLPFTLEKKETKRNEDDRNEERIRKREREREREREGCPPKTVAQYAAALRTELQARVNITCTSGRKSTVLCCNRVLRLNGLLFARPVIFFVRSPWIKTIVSQSCFS